MIKRTILYTILSVCGIMLAGQQPARDLAAHRTPYAPKIDGKLTEVSWQDAAEAANFFQHSPYNGIDPRQPTVVRVMYDDRAIYVGAIMYDSAPDSIYRELGERDDDNINADFFTVDILPYNDGLNAFEFKVFASGVEGDTKHAANYHDENWDPIWKSAVEITDSGWVAEIEIPYAALRFPNTEEQLWGMNFWRNNRRYREFSTWNYVDNKQEGVFNQYGTLSGIQDIKPPLRLFFIPYLAGYTEKIPEADSWAYSYNYGLDMKLGLSESFTLDMTLVPDFGQVQSDDKIVNLSPFETYYQERRPFFTEGTELFERGGIFYTRRVGGTPRGYRDVRNEYHADSIIENPEDIQLLNATKITGRTRKGTAIGVFNAVNGNTHARVIDSAGYEQKILTHPASNYNMLVFDQSLKNNSYISLYNTNVYRGRNEDIANVSGTEFEFRNKKDMWSLEGVVNISQKYHTEGKPDIGHAYSLEAGKISGNFRFKYEHDVQSDDYDINDMGFNRRNNRFDNDLELEYNIYDPVGIIINMQNELGFYYDMLYKPRKYTSFNIFYNNRTTFANYITAGLNWRFNPVEEHDYYEPRVDGWYIEYPKSAHISAFISPDYRKRFVVDFSAGGWKTTKYVDQNISGYNASLRPRYRFSDNFTLKLRMSYDHDFNTLGYVTDSLNAVGEQIIIIGRRNVQTVENVIDAKYIFTKNMAFTLRARHYWFKVDYQQYYRLREDGGLNPSDYSSDHNFVFNAFNIDMVYRWTFAPASELIFVWKNNIYAEKEDIANNYFSDIRYTFNSPMGNSFSLKVLYYLDYQSLRKKNRKAG